MYERPPLHTITRRFLDLEKKILTNELYDLYEIKIKIITFSNEIKRRGVVILIRSPHSLYITIPHTHTHTKSPPRSL